MGLTLKEFKSFQKDFYSGMPTFEIREKYPYLNNERFTAEDIQDFAVYNRR